MTKKQYIKAKVIELARGCYTCGLELTGYKVTR